MISFKIRFWIFPKAIQFWGGKVLKLRNMADWRPVRLKIGPLLPVTVGRLNSLASVQINNTLSVSGAGTGVHHNYPNQGIWDVAGSGSFEGGTLLSAAWAWTTTCNSLEIVILQGI